MGPVKVLGEGGRLIERNVSYDDAIAAASRIHQHHDETITLVDIATGEEVVIEKPNDDAAASSELPGTHAELDAIAAERGISFPSKAKVAEKQQILAEA